MTEQNKQELNRAKTETRFHSELEVFKCTNGIRPGEFSVIVAPSGNGKSTLCKTISIECATSKKRCYHLLSEEVVDVYKAPIASTISKSHLTPDEQDEVLNNLFFETMLDWKPEEETLDYLFSYLEDVMNEHAPEMIIFDNFTTSFVGELNISLQGKAIKMFRKFAAAYDIAIIGVFHTTKGSDIYKQILSGEDVRGNSTSTNAGSYNYILSTYFRADKPRTFLLLDKARYHSKFNKTFWELKFHPLLEIFTGCERSSYEEIKELVSLINKKKAPTKKGSREWLN